MNSVNRATALDASRRATVTNCLALAVTIDPVPGVTEPGPHQTYRWPQLLARQRELTELSPDSLRVEPLLVGVCGTDLHLIRAHPETGYVTGSAPFLPGADGRILGHEGVARVLEVGSQVQEFEKGDLIALASLLACRSCDVCRRGLLNHCSRSRLLGLEFDGLFSTVADIPAALAYKVNDLADSQNGLCAAACMEPAACAYLALEKAALQKGESLLVLGAGPIGTFAVQLGRFAFGASSVEVVEPVAFRRNLAGRWSDEVREQLTEAGRTVDVVVEASGDLGHLDLALRRMNPGGRMVVLGRGGQPLHLTGVDCFISRGIRLIASRGHLGACEKILQLIRSGQAPLDQVVTGRVEGLDALKNEFECSVPLEHRHTKLLCSVNG